MNMREKKRPNVRIFKYELNVYRKRRYMYTLGFVQVCAGYDLKPQAYCILGQKMSRM